MFQQRTRYHRRRFLQTVGAAGAAFAVPHFVPASALGKDGGVAASERIVMGGIGIGNRGTYDLGCFLPEPDVQFIAICDVKAERRAAAKKMVDQPTAIRTVRHTATFASCWPATTSMPCSSLRDRTGMQPPRLWRPAPAKTFIAKSRHQNIAQSLALAAAFRRTGRVFQAGTRRRNLPHFAFACELTRTGKLGKLQKVYAHPAGMSTVSSGWAAAEPAPPQEEVDWDLYLGPAAWRPFNRALLDGFNFEKGGGMVGGGVLEWGSHCVDLCQWANNADATAPVEYNPPENDVLVAQYENGVKLVIRNEGWLPLGSCPVQFEGDAGWIETGDSGQFVLSSPALLAGRKVEEIGGYPATFHVRDFLNCVKSRGKPLANADVACYSHITCHAANITVFLQRKLTYDPRKNEFLGDEAANRLRSEALREPWRI